MKTIWMSIVLLGVWTQSTIGKYADDAIEFEIIIPSYNNAQWCIQNLKSATSQKYPSFHITYIDDCSTDGTGELVEKFVHDNHLQDRVRIIHNKKRQGAMTNWYHAIRACDDHIIIVQLDGDDMLAHPQVLEKLATIYSQYDVWLTYGQFIEWPNGSQGWCVPMSANIVKHNAFRDFVHMPSHLRTFYAWLFKEVKREDFEYKGKWVEMTCDQAMMFPMIEMAGDRHAFISEIMYLYNSNNALSDHIINENSQRFFSQVIRAKKRYARLPHPIIPLKVGKPLYKK